MARGKTLTKLLDELRAEARDSLNPAHNNQVRDSYVNLLQRTQERLWDDFDWPHLVVERTINLQAGQRYYDPPGDIAIDRITDIQVRYGQQWCPLAYRIDACHYSTWDSDLDQRSWPVERYMIYEGEQFEVWPIPADNADDTTLEGKLKVFGVRNLNPLVADDDRADLDDRLLVLYCAAELLAARGAKDAQMKLKQADTRYKSLRSNLTPSRRFKLFKGRGYEGKKLHGPPRVHYRIMGP